MDSPPNIVETCATALQSHTNKVADLLPNTQSFMRSWQKKLQAILASHNTTLVQFLDKPNSEWTCKEDTNLDTELGFPLHSVQDKLQTIMNLYKQTVADMFSKHESMQNKLKTLSDLQKKL